jgi:hypothetical protein
LIEAFHLWHQVKNVLAPQFPNYKVNLWYACKGEGVPEAAKIKASALEMTIKSIMPMADIHFSFAGALNFINLLVVKN